MPCIMGTAASSPRQSPWKRTQAHLKAALAVAMYRVRSGLPESSAPHPILPLPPHQRGLPAEKMGCINNDVTSAFPADGPDLETACRLSLKSDFCFLGHLEFFFVTLVDPRAI